MMLRSICIFVCFLGWDGHIVEAQEVKAQEVKAQEVKLVTGSFKPGKLGILADWNSGRVKEVPEGGQGEREGVEVGMVIVKVNDRDYLEAVLDRAVAGDSEYKLTFKKFPPPPPPKQKEEDTPPKPDFKYATELTADTFHEKVYKVTNWTELGDITNPPYYPVVLFHVSWCKHCKHALPEFEKAAQMVEESQQKGELRHHDAIPKFFVIECDLIAEHKKLCDQHTSTNYPVAKLYRDQRAVRFNRPRIAQTYAWWATHVARQPLAELRSADLSELDKQRGPLFVLKANPEDTQAFQSWTEVALDHIEAHQFLHVKPSEDRSSKLPPAPSVSVFGSSLEPLPFEGEFSREQLAEWVNINQFEAVTDLDAHSGHALRESGLVVVVFSYRMEGDSNDATLTGQFEFIAKQLRTGRQFLFAAIDVSKDDNADYLEHTFPLLSPKISPPPRIFAFAGEDTYWEDPSFTDPAKISRESIEGLLASGEALQDGTTFSMVREKRKRVVRFATGSTMGLAITLGSPFALGGILWFCIKAICSADEPEKVEKVD